MSDKQNNRDRPIQRVQGKEPEPDTQSWYDYSWKTQQDTPTRLEDCAKFLTGTISICLTLFLCAGKSTFESHQLTGWAGMALGLWLLSLVLCMLVLFPWQYRFRNDSVQSIKSMHKRIVKAKYRMLAAGFLLFLIALAILIALFFK